MKLITEVYESIEYISEANENGEKEYFIEGIFMQANKKNRNGRMYPTEVLEREVDRYNKEYVVKNRAFGELGHPQGPTINLERVSHMIKELKKDGKPHSYIFKWYLCAYVIIAVIVIYLEYDNWFGV